MRLTIIIATVLIFSGFSSAFAQEQNQEYAQKGTFEFGGVFDSQSVFYQTNSFEKYRFMISAMPVLNYFVMDSFHAGAAPVYRYSDYAHESGLPRNYDYSYDAGCVLFFGYTFNPAKSVFLDFSPEAGIFSKKIYYTSQDLDAIFSRHDYDKYRYCTAGMMISLKVVSGRMVFNIIFQPEYRKYLRKTSDFESTDSFSTGVKIGLSAFL